MNIVLSFCSLCVLLAFGKLLRVKVRLFQKLYLPASVIAGLVGLVCLQVGGSYLPAGLTAGWDKLPGFLINIVFASLFLGVTIPRIGGIWQKAGPQLAYGQIVAWGQYVVGLGLCIAILTPLFGVPGYLGTIVPVGFEGGHGTAGGVKETFVHYGWDEGTDYALASATAGLIFAIVMGMALVNWAVRRGYARKLARIEDMPESNIVGVYEVEERPIAGWQTVTSASVDTLALHISIIGIAVLIGYLIRQGLLQANLLLFPPEGDAKPFMGGFPLFPLCMIGGLIVQTVSTRFSKVQPIDHELVQRVSGTAMDFLVVSAIAVIRIEVIREGFIAFVLLIGGGVIWNLLCVTWLARRLLPSDSWFERSIAEMGQSMGVTATGLLLLRVVDPKNETDAASAFGYKQILHEPFMGGGLWTSLAIPLAITRGPLLVFSISLVAIVAWLAVWAVLFRGRLDS